jgi:hypothetical protein
MGPMAGCYFGSLRSDSTYFPKVLPREPPYPLSPSYLPIVLVLVILLGP